MPNGHSTQVLVIDHELIVLPLERISFESLGPLLDHLLGNFVPLLALELVVDLVFGFDQLGVVFFFDDDEVGLEAAENMLEMYPWNWDVDVRVAIWQGRVGGLVTSHFFPCFTNVVPGLARVAHID
jgi:hypothetical protein